MSTMNSTTDGYLSFRTDSAADDMRRVSCQLMFTQNKRKRKASLRTRVKEAVHRLIYLA